MRNRVKQQLKNAVYRGIGEVGTRAGGGRRDATLRVLLYHKVNDLPENRMSVPVALFDEQMAQIAELGYHPVDLDAVLAHYGQGAPLPPRAVLVTFDDGYRDNLVNAAPVLARHGFPAVQFVPLAYVGEAAPLPHERSLVARGVRNPTVSWGEVRELDAAGFRVESHGISHMPLARLAPAAAARELSDSKAMLEEQLGRPVRAFAYVKGSRADYTPEHVRLAREAGYELAFTTVSGGNSPQSDPLQLRRYNVEPYAARTFELVLSGACDAVSLKDTVAGTRARRLLNAALRTS